MKVEIKLSGNSLWLIIDGDDNTAWAISEDELLPIRDAINEYLKKKDDN